MTEQFNIILFEFTGKRQLVEHVRNTAFPETAILYPNNFHEAQEYLKKSPSGFVLVNPAAGSNNQSAGLTDGDLLLKTAATSFPHRKCIAIGDDIGVMTRNFCLNKGIPIVGQAGGDFTESLESAMRSALANGPSMETPFAGAKARPA